MPALPIESCKIAHLLDHADLSLNLSSFTCTVDLAACLLISSTHCSITGSNVFKNIPFDFFDCSMLPTSSLPSAHSFTCRLSSH